MGNKQKEVDMRGAEIGVLQTFMDSYDDEIKEEVLENEKVAQVIIDAGLEVPVDALELADFLA
eukprot:CAMPEP_0176378320 /NCGR_PEP_ID=MMETSP0126-20121128/29533_1 /TAXON_ID=141414 ORGANISM="Strombidinopsis acuminatum, Strain SPMC142" /NCGR_SAMPLE_ID=MMETSP0126 /ASSEMBLY_ACC=CAM_ASM_000229 /LENGTH=62 /DNA_ID=CAMNT_0017740565 /DNA_START=23 /DNA_END=211 /DNA_ORIENTATION=+